MSRITITPGSRIDLLSLQDHHYNNAEPATIAAVLRANWYDTLAGVLVVSYPTLNADWRSIAFGPAFKLSCKGDLARKTNKHIRSIARIIVEPRFRGLGIATQLVRHYLASPLTPCTEAVSVLNAFIPLFSRAGMRRIDLPPSIRDRILTRQLADIHITPLDLATVATHSPLSPQNKLLLAAIHPWLLRWGQSHRGTRKLQAATTLARYAAKSLLLPRVVFAAGSLAIPRQSVAKPLCA